ncbi:pol polyprotein [Tanacetum coccineum]
MDLLLIQRSQSLQEKVNNKLRVVQHLKLKPLAITTTTAFEVSHEDAYDSDVDEAPHAAAAFMANLMHRRDHLFGQATSITRRKLFGGFLGDGYTGKQLDSDVDSVIDDHDNTISYHQYQLNNEVESVPTDVSFVIPEQLVSLKQQLLQHVESKSLKTESEKLKADKNALEESYLKELVWLRNTNKDLHKSALGHRNPLYLKSAQLCRPTLYLGDVIVDLVHTPFRVYDSEETLVQAEVSRTKMLERMKDLLSKVSSKPINYAKLKIYICSVVLNSDIVMPMSVEPRSKCVEEHSKNLELEAEILKVCNNSSSPEHNVFFEINKLKDQIQGKDELIRKITKPEVVPLEKSGSVSTSEPANNVIVTPRFSKKPLTSYKHKDSKLKDISTGSPPNIETKAVNDPENLKQAQDEERDKRAVVAERRIIAVKSSQIRLRFLHLLPSGSIVVISRKAKYVTDGHQFVGAHNNMHMMQKRTLLLLLSQLTLLGPSNPRSMYLHIWFGGRDCHGLEKGTASLRMHLDCFSAHALLKERGRRIIAAELLSYTTKEGICLKNKSGFNPLHITASEGHQGILAAAIGAAGEVDYIAKLSNTMEQGLIVNPIGPSLLWSDCLVRLYNSFGRCTLGNRRQVLLHDIHARFLDYKMVDSKSVVSQVQVLLHDIHAEGMTLSETFQVAAIIEKLPPSWVEFKNYLKHKRKEMSVEDLVVRLRIEEDNKLAQERLLIHLNFCQGNMVSMQVPAQVNSKGNKKDKKKNDKKGKGKSEYLAPKAGIVKQKFQGTCYNCDQPGHRAANCKMPKRANPRQANMVDENVDMIAMVSDVCAMISEVKDMLFLRDNIRERAQVELRSSVSSGDSRKNLCPHCLRFIVHESKNPDIQKNTIMESRNASFFENIFPGLSKGTGSSSRLDDKVVQDKRQRDDNDLQMRD